MAWQQNLFSNLLVVFILLAIVIIAYLKVKKLTLPEFFREIREATSSE